MDAEIIAIGAEIVSGAKLDTNSQWLSVELGSCGIPVRGHTSVGDDLAAMVDALAGASRRADLLLVTGGLGPTLDDLTRQAVAQLAGVALVEDARSLAQIEALFRARGRPMPERNRLQAQFPRGAEPLENPIGTAPGLWMLLPRPGREPCRLAALPGVPSEMRRMFHEQVVPRLPPSEMVIRQARLNCFGCGESQAEQLLGDLTARGRDPEIGITAHDATITLRIEARGRSESECAQKIETASATIRQQLGHYIFGIEDEQLEDCVTANLAARHETLSVVDCGSRGWLAAALSSVRGPAGELVRGTLTCARMSDAARVLGFEASDGPAAVGLAKLAEASRKRFASTYALAVGEVPDVASDELAQGHWRCEIVLAGPPGERRTTLATAGNPAILSARLGKKALDLLRLSITDWPDSTDSDATPWEPAATVHPTYK